MPLLIDFGALPEEACNCAFDELFKALSEPGGKDAGIFVPMNDTILARYVETATARFQAILETIEDAIARAHRRADRAPRNQEASSVSERAPPARASTVRTASAAS